MQNYNPYAAPETRVKSEPLTNGRPTALVPRLSMNKPIAIFLWAVACVTTYQLVGALRPDLSVRSMVAAAIGAQVIFTWLEKPVLRGKPNKISSAVLLLDTLTNAGGIFPMAMRAPETPMAQMVIAAFHMSPAMSPLAALLLSLVAGFLLAAAPEAVWRWKE
jgi:hypothetical protein